MRQTLAFKTFAYLFFFLRSFLLFAEPFPHGCEVKGFFFNQSLVVLNESGQQSFYLIQNRGKKPLRLRRFQGEEAFMSPSLAIKLDPLQWAAFSSDIANLPFQCLEVEAQTEKTEESVNPVDCQEVLDLCQYPRVKFALSNMGNYWVSVNKAKQDVIQESTRKGILLRW